jgi:hypothetical protein
MRSMSTPLLRCSLTGVYLHILIQAYQMASRLTRKGMSGQAMVMVFMFVFLRDIHMSVMTNVPCILSDDKGLES